MVEVVRAISIGRTRAACFDFIADVERYAEWQRGSAIGRVIVRGDDPVGLGTKFRLESRFAGRRRVWVDAVISGFDRPGRFEYRSVGWRGFELAVLADLTGEGPATRLAWRVSLATPRALRPLAPLIAREIGHRAEMDLTTLKRALEAAPKPAA